MEWVDVGYGLVSLPAQVRPEGTYVSSHRDGATETVEVSSVTYWGGAFRLAILVSRDFNDYALARRKIASLTRTKNRVVVYSRGHHRAEAAALAAADSLGYMVERSPVDFKAHGKTAATVARADALDNSEALLAFWDGTDPDVEWGINAAIAAGKPVRIVYSDGKSEAK